MSVLERGIQGLYAIGETIRGDDRGREEVEVGRTRWARVVGIEVGLCGCGSINLTGVEEKGPEASSRSTIEKPEYMKHHREAFIILVPL
jgi:hypothetical protein